MSKLAFFSLACFVALPSLTSCSRFYPSLIGNYSSDPTLFEIGPKTSPASDDFYNKNGTVNAKGSTFQNLFERAVRKDKEARNELISRSMLASDRIAHRTTSAILLNQSGTNITLGTATSLFSGLSTFVGGESTRSALAAAATFANAERSLINEEIYQNAFATAVVKQIEAGRATLRTSINAGLDKGTDRYSIYQALSDLENYHNRASFTYGLTQVVDKSFRTPSATERMLILEDLRSRIPDNRTELLNAVDAEMKAVIQGSSS